MRGLQLQGVPGLTSLERTCLLELLPSCVSEWPLRACGSLLQQPLEEPETSRSQCWVIVPGSCG